MKFIKKSPLFLILLFTGILFTLAAVGGRSSIYKDQEFDIRKAPFLSILFTGINDDIYPWQLFEDETVETAAVSEEEDAAPGQPEETGTAEDGEKNPKNAQGGQPESGEEAASKAPSASPAVSPSPLPAAPTALPEASPEEVSAAEPEIPEGRLEPLRESTHEEYLNHISADIYGDAGVIRAASCEFATVDESYFDDALFIGDSRTVGLRDYTDLPEHADFLCETSLTIYKVMEESFKGKGTVEEVLAAKKYGKIYLMVGINELGRGTTEDFMEEYTKVVDTLHELAPDAKIFIQGIMRVSGKKNESDAIFNNSNINARNNAIATLADNRQMFYIDVNEAVCDGEGNLTADYTHDQIHLLGMYNEIWKEFLLEHGVAEE